MNLEETPAKKKWQKPVGIILSILAYAFLAAGIALACLSWLSLEVRVYAPIFGAILFALAGAWGFVFCERAELVFSLSEYAWSQQPHGNRALYMITFPCRFLAVIFQYFNGA
ncbi:MAG: hypothetical protein K2G44_02565 [Clostridia bacterium]|nr:hypothetical protein [Clostridia bacterium]